MLAPENHHVDPGPFPAALPDLRTQSVPRPGQRAVFRSVIRQDACVVVVPREMRRGRRKPGKPSVEEWDGEPYATFQRLVRKAEADLEARMVTALSSQANVRPELALAILERKFPQRWAKVTVVAMPPPAGMNDLAAMLRQIDVQRQAERAARGQLPPASTIIDATAIPGGRLQDPRGPRPARPPDDGVGQFAGSAEPTAGTAKPVTPVEGRSVVPATVTRLGSPRPPA